MIHENEIIAFLLDHIKRFVPVRSTLDVEAHCEEKDGVSLRTKRSER